MKRIELSDDILLEVYDSRRILTIIKKSRYVL